MCVCPHQNHKGLSVATLPIQLVLPRNIFKNPSVCPGMYLKIDELLPTHQIHGGKWWRKRYMFFKNACVSTNKVSIMCNSLAPLSNIKIMVGWL